MPLANILITKRIATCVRIPIFFRFIIINYRLLRSSRSFRLPRCPDFPGPWVILSRLACGSSLLRVFSLTSLACRMRVAHKGNIFRTCEACAAASVLHSQEPLHRMEWRFIRHVGIRMIIHVWPTVLPVRQSFIAPFLLYLFFLLSCILKYPNILLFHGLCFCSRSR